MQRQRKFAKKLPQGPAQLRAFEKAIDLQIKSLKDTGKPLTKEDSEALYTALNALQLSRLPRYSGPATKPSALDD